MSGQPLKSEARNRGEGFLGGLSAPLAGLAGQKVIIEDLQKEVVFLFGVFFFPESLDI